MAPGLEDSVKITLAGLGLSVMMGTLLFGVTTSSLAAYSSPIETQINGSCSSVIRASACDSSSSTVEDPANRKFGAVYQAYDTPGTVLYQADWSAGFAGWNGEPNWKILRGMLVSDGSRGGIIFSPFQPSRPDYAVEAEIQVLQMSDGCWDRFGFALFVRQSQFGRYRGYVGPDRCYANVQAIMFGGGLGSDPSEVSRDLRRPFQTGAGWRTYRLEVSGNELRFLIDEYTIISSADNRLLEPGGVGLSAGGGTQINVRSFKVLSQ
jgi:hypothetical protein